MAVYKRGKHWHMDVMVNGVRYREALDTTDRREALSLEKKRVGEIQAGKGASKAGRAFSRLGFSDAADEFLRERKPHVADRTYVLERNLLNPLRKFFAEKPLLRIRAEDISAYQGIRRGTGISGRTLNMEVGVLRRMMKRGRTWSVVAEDVRLDRENKAGIGKVLTQNEKAKLFAVAASKPEWLVVHCAAVLAASTTCRGVELKHLRWEDVDLFDRKIAVRRSKTAAGHRTLPLNRDAMAALTRLSSRAQALGVLQPEAFVFPACERFRIDPEKPQKTWRTAWRSLIRETARQVGREAASEALKEGKGLGGAKRAWRRAAKPFRGFRFHDLRHQAITELAESGEPDATIMAMAGHLDRDMMEHYSHVRMAAKRSAATKLEGGLMGEVPTTENALPDAVQ